MAHIEGIHYDVCPHAYEGHGESDVTAECPVCTFMETNDFRHWGHDLITDYPFDGEPILWCNGCNETVWYIESGCAA